MVHHTGSKRLVSQAHLRCKHYRGVTSKSKRQERRRYARVELRLGMLSMKWVGATATLVNWQQ
jgi:hypothetical protein